MSSVKSVTKEIQAWEIKYGQVLFSGQNYDKAYTLFQPLLNEKATFQFKYPQGEQERNFVHINDKRIIRLACKSFFSKLEPGTKLKFTKEMTNIRCSTISNKKGSKHGAILNSKQFEKLFEKADVLGKMILAMRQIYAKAKPNQQKLMETMIGAAIFYFPRSEKLWTNKISERALEIMRDSGTTKGLTKDHEYPRKEAGRELLMGHTGVSENIAAEICELYLTKYGRYNWVTSPENRKLVPFQKEGTFTKPFVAYRKAGITLIKLSTIDFKNLFRKTLTKE